VLVAIDAPMDEQELNLIDDARAEDDPPCGPG
jgi:hypothetical protein